eukprot:TRINITY_DN20344_c0_g1_i2.p2 TRINITY_DN20344_c0_g1~~TRINITY_DN20344_c0_g1_i2.p2  ORF type:complete len:107 (-),score=24.46 TRINITY_DN20344_c0_g1_i2:221-541(-)
MMDCYRCVMVTIEQQGPRSGERPSGLQLLRRLKDFRVMPASSHGPLPRSDPNVAMFAALDGESGGICEGEEVLIETSVSSPQTTVWQCRKKEGWDLTDDRFWIQKE